MIVSDGALVMRKTIAFSPLVLLAWAFAVDAQEPGGRAGTFEVGFAVFDTSAVTLRGQGGSSIAVDGDIGHGAVGAYNLTERFALVAELSGTRPRYAAVLTAEDTGLDAVVNTQLDASVVLLKAVYYFLERNLTPYVEVGAGWAAIDSNIIEGPPLTRCWWDPWWGYVCGQLFDTYTDTRKASSAAIGMRFDFGRSLLLKASWGTLRIDTTERTDDHRQSLLRLELMWKF